MFKSRNIIVTNAKTQYKLKKGSKIVFKSNILIEFAKVLQHLWEIIKN